MGYLISNRLRQQNSGNRRIHAARKRAKRASAANLCANHLNRVFYKGIHSPASLTPADLPDKIKNHLRPFVRMCVGALLWCAAYDAYFRWNRKGRSGAGIWQNGGFCQYGNCIVLNVTFPDTSCHKLVILSSKINDDHFFLIHYLRAFVAGVEESGVYQQIYFFMNRNFPALGILVLAVMFILAALSAKFRENR